MCGGQAFVQLLIDTGDDGLQPSHADLGTDVQCVQTVITDRFDHVPHVHQMHWRKDEREFRIKRLIDNTVSNATGNNGLYVGPFLIQNKV